MNQLSELSAPNKQLHFCFVFFLFTQIFIFCGDSHNSLPFGQEQTLHESVWLRASADRSWSFTTSFSSSLLGNRKEIP